jgi:hypothetical protein
VKSPPGSDQDLLRRSAGDRAPAAGLKGRCRADVDLFEDVADELNLLRFLVEVT